MTTSPSSLRVPQGSLTGSSRFYDVMLYPPGSGLRLSFHFLEAARHLQNVNDLGSGLTLFGFEC